MTTLVQAALGDMPTLSNEETGVERWILSKVTGWYAMDVRTTLVDREQDDGAFTPGPSFRNPRALTVQGFVISSSAAEAVQECWDAILGLSPDGGDIDLAYTDAAGTRVMTVRLTGTTSVDPITDTRASFSISLVAYDPRKYALTPTSQRTTVQGSTIAGAGLKFPLFNKAGKLDFGSPARLGVATVTNRGTAKTFPTFTITGGFPSGFAITDSTGAQVRYVKAVDANETIVIDMRNKRAISNGVNDYTDSLAEVDTITLGKMETKTFQIQALGSFTAAAGLTVTIRDTWW